MADKNLTIYERLRRFLNPSIKGKMTDAVLKALAVGDQMNHDNILFAKDQMFIVTATGSYLAKLLSGIGVTKPVNTGIDDKSFRDIAIKQTATKVVSNIYLDILEAFYGADAVKAWTVSSKTEGYKLEDGMTLIVSVDNQKLPITITFNAADFANIAHATANEVCSVISRNAFNYGYPLIAVIEEDKANNLLYIKLQSLTKGPKSSVTVMGGSAQNVFKFPLLSTSAPKYGTEFTTSFVNQFIRFTWSAGPDPAIQFLNEGDVVNIYGSGINAVNQGSFTVQNFQGGAVNQTYFDIINPMFTPQGTIVCTPNNSVSGEGVAKATCNIAPSPNGLVRSSGLTTVTTLVPHNYVTGSIITISNAENSTFLGTFGITVTGANTYTFGQGLANAVSGGGVSEIAFSIDIEPVGAVRLNGISTITTKTNHTFQVGQSVTLSGLRDSSFGGTYSVTAVTSSSFQFAQDDSNTITFFTPKRITITSLARYATLYETSPYEVTIFLPVTTNVIRRSLIGSCHLRASSLDKSYLGSYVFNPKSGVTISGTSCKLNQDLASGDIKTVVQFDNTLSFQDGEGYLMLNWGQKNQEGPIRFLSRPSASSLLIDASYKFKQSHLSGSSVHLINSTAPYSPKPDGSDYQAYLTDTSAGRLNAEDIINKIKMAGTFLNIIIVVPDGKGQQSMSYVYDLLSTDTVV
jgi:hypothetical protein